MGMKALKCELQHEKMYHLKCSQGPGYSTVFCESENKCTVDSRYLDFAYLE